MTWLELYLSDTSGVCKHLNHVKRANILGFMKEEWVSKNTKCGGCNCQYTFNNLWLCVEENCFHIGCGRRDNAHAMDHFKQTKHSLTLKLNTFEMWCYGCERWIGQKGAKMVEVGSVQELRNDLCSCCHYTPSTDIFNRRQKERDFEQAKKTDKRWAITTVGWVKKWERFIIGDIEHFTEKIDNSALLDHTSTAVRPGLTCDDYRVFSMSAWDMLVAHYGGGPLVVFDWDQNKWIVGNFGGI